MKALAIRHTNGTGEQAARRTSASAGQVTPYAQIVKLPSDCSSSAIRRAADGSELLFKKHLRRYKNRELVRRGLVSGRIGETVICGLPDMDMAGDKWREDILPVIEQSRYRNLLPRSGSGSRGGKVEALQLRNGATLKFMSGGGSDKSRAGFTARVVVITETDGMDRPGAASRESDKITQLEARTRAYGSRKRIYMECTVSTEQGRTWQEYQQGTRSRILLPCPHCGEFVAPERDHLTGWQAADSHLAAKLQARFICPSCNTAWSEEQREVANHNAKLIHGKQKIENHIVVGAAPQTETLGFRWSAVNNQFLTAGDVAADEWRASRAADQELAEREMRQFVWCVPVEASKRTQTPLEIMELAARQGSWGRGIVPPDTRWLTAAIDIGKHLMHWAVGNVAERDRDAHRKRNSRAAAKTVIVPACEGRAHRERLEANDEEWLLPRELIAITINP